MIEYSLLGGLEVRQDGRALELGGAKQRTVLAALLVAPGTAVAPDVLVERVWHGAPPESPEASLQAYVSNLRRLLEPTRRPREAPNVLVTRPTGYLVVAERSQIDVGRFEDLATDGQKLLTAGEPGAAVELLDRALATWGGPLLPEMMGAPWVLDAAERLGQIRAQALEDRFEAGLLSGESAALVARIESAIADDPYRERLRAQLALALYRAGRQRDALSSLQRARSTLAEEVGVEPGPELRALERAVLDQDPSLDLVAPAPGRAPAPPRRHAFLFTDIEGSTAMWETDREAMARAQARHDDLVAEVVGAHRGRAFNQAGDGFAVVFSETPDAVGAASELQRRLATEDWPTSLPLRVRIGIHVGESDERDGDHFGPAVNLAARVAAAGHGGQVLVTSTAADACAGAGLQVPTRSLGTVTLRGVAAPVELHQLVGPGLDATFPPLRSAVVELPGAEATRQLVGREAELAALVDAHRAAAAGRGGPVVVSGEPGIGKTRLVEELLSLVPDSVVAWGRCPETAAQAAYLPCIQIARQLDGAVAIDDEFASMFLPDDDVQHLDPGAERLALHVAVARFLAGWDRPVVVVVDDLQWADPASLRLIEFVAADLARTRVLLVVTVRPLTADAPVELVDCLGELARQTGAVRIDLTGLDGAAVEEWMQRRTGGAVDEGVVGQVLDRTGGNPFFVGEVIELLAGEGRLDDAHAAPTSAVPAAVQDVVRRRVGRLPAPSQQLLAAASVAGRTFDLDVVARVTGTTVVDVLERLEPALDTGLVAEGQVPGRFAFAHALVAETLEAELNVARRARLHATTAEALAALRPGELDPLSATLAHHAFEGAAAGTADAAYEWSVRAAAHAAARGAHEDVANHWSRAVEALTLSRPADVPARIDALLEQALALLRVDRVSPAFEALKDAMQLALGAGDVERLGRAAVAMTTEGLWMAGGDVVTTIDVHPVLEQAVGALPDTPTVERALGLANLADNGYWVWTPERLDEVSAEAVATARAVGDPGVLLRTLQKRTQAMWRPSGYEQGKAASDEMHRMAEAGELPADQRAIALFATAASSWEGADVPRARTLVAEALDLAQQLGIPALITQLQFFQVALHTWDGRLDDSRRLLSEAYDLYRRTRRWAAEPIRAGFLIVAATEQLDLDGVEDAAAHLLEPPYTEWFREGLIWSLVETGRTDEAEAQLHLQGMPPTLDCWLLAGLATAAVHSRVSLGHTEHLLELRRTLLPMSGRLGSTGTGSAFGDIDFALARLDHLLGDHDSALRFADSSLATLTAAGEGPWLARLLRFRTELTGDQADAARAEEIVDRLDSTSLPCAPNADPTTSGGRERDPSGFQAGSEGFEVAPKHGVRRSSHDPDPHGGTAMSDTTPDLSTYRAIHLAFRGGARGLARAAAEVRPDDRARVAALRKYWNGYREELRLHHTTEDDVFFPRLVERVAIAGELIARTDAEHHEMDEIMARCDRAVEALTARRVVPDLAMAFTDLEAHIEHHLDFEDTDILPLFERHFTGAEYEELDRAAMEALGLGKQAAFTVPFAMYFQPADAVTDMLAEAPLPLKVLWRLTKGHHARLAVATFGTASRALPRVRGVAA